MPDCALTRARTVSPSVSMSWAVASPVLMRKLQCISDTCAPPTRRPRQPAASTSFHALCPGGFLNVEPPVFSRIGCALSRCACTTVIRARTASGAAGIPRNRAEVKISDGSTPLPRYPNFMPALSKRRSVPSRAMAEASTRTSLVSPPLAPAFIRSAPPMVPGMPNRNSSPPRSAAAAASATRLSSAAVPACTRSPSTRTSPKPRGDRRITTPGKPPSRTIRFEPTPMQQTGMSLRRCARK